MTPDERADIVRRLLAMQHSLRSVADAAERQGELCDAAGAKGLAFAVYMLREAVAAYSVALNDWVTKFLADDDFAAGIE